MANVFEPLSVLVGTILVVYSVRQLLFNPFHGPIPGRLPTLAGLVTTTVLGVALLKWGTDRLELLRPS